MKRAFVIGLVLGWAGLAMVGCRSHQLNTTGEATAIFESSHLGSGRGVAGGTLKLDGIYYETSTGRVPVRGLVFAGVHPGSSAQGTVHDAAGRLVQVKITSQGESFNVSLSATPAADIKGWGFALDAGAYEYFTGLMERVVDGAQQESWAPGIQAAMNLRGQQVDMILKPTTSVYAPFYVSSRGYGLFVKTLWPGHYDFCATDPHRVKVRFEGPALDFKLYTAGRPGAIVQAHALEVGPPLVPPKWVFKPWRWRDEHHQRATFYDGTPANGPFNTEMMEDVLLMKAYGIPCGVYWIDRPWGPGRLGYDDFEIDEHRLPNFAASVKWLDDLGAKMVLWIGPFFQGEMETNALARGYTLPGQEPQRNNYPLADFSNPAARQYWQDGVAKLLKLGVAGFKLDRGEEGIPDDGPFRIHDGRSLREQRNDYPLMYLKATYDVARQYRGDDFVCLPRAAYTGSSPYGVFWGGDIGGVPEGLRASIIAVQRAAVMGYPTWGSDTCGYSRATMDQELCSRWLAFSCFTPIMEVGPTKNLAFWDMPTEPSYSTNLIATWRFYARLHDRLADYSHQEAEAAAHTGLPIVRPLFLADPQAPAAWDNWWTYLYGRDVLVSPIWAKGQKTQQVYLPAGSDWKDAWNLEKTYRGGQTITVPAELPRIPIFVRADASLDLGDLNQEWIDALQAAAQRPDLKALAAQAQAWFEKQHVAAR